METTNKNIISSFKVQEELNPDIWYYDGESYKMKPEIRISLLDIVKDYTDFIDVELLVFESLIPFSSRINS